MGDEKEQPTFYSFEYEEKQRHQKDSSSNLFVCKRDGNFGKAGKGGITVELPWLLVGAGRVKLMMNKYEKQIFFFFDRIQMKMIQRSNNNNSIVLSLSVTKRTNEQTDRRTD